MNLSSCSILTLPSMWTIVGSSPRGLTLRIVILLNDTLTRGTS
jgi:hypothetical protein